MISAQPQPDGVVYERFDWYYKDNGFGSLAEMRRAHAPLLRTLRTVPTNDRASVVDLGCGNGALLRELCRTSDAVVPFGVDFTAEKIERARSLLPAYRDNFVCADIYAVDAWAVDRLAHCDLCLVVPARLMQAEPAHRAPLMQWLNHDCGCRIVYAYVDALMKYGSLTTMTEAVGWPIKTLDESGMVGVA